jgi:choline kinase
VRAIIYAAGRATRLGPAYVNVPKILLSFSGRSLLEWHVLWLARFGVERISVVTGYLRDQVQEALAPLPERYGVPMREIYNPNFTEGSALSVHVSLPEIQSASGPVLLLDGDVLYEERVMRRLIESPRGTTLLIDRGYSTADDDPVLVPVRRGKPFEFAKKWHGEAEHVGESVGFFKVAPPDIPLLVQETVARTIGKGRLDSYDEIVRALVKAGRFGYEDVTGLAWTEIDFPQDVEYARERVLPELLRAGMQERFGPELRSGG